MLELLFVIGFFVMLMVTGVSLLGIIAALIVAYYRRADCGDGLYVPRRYAGIDD